MTKSEAKAIHECTARCMRLFNGIAVDVAPMTPLYDKIGKALDEVQRVHDMAIEELGRK